MEIVAYTAPLLRVYFAIDNSQNCTKMLQMEDNMTTDRVRILTHITPEADQKVEAFMKFSGMTKAKVCSLAIIAGIDVFTLATDPNWKEYFLKTMGTDDEKKK